MSGPEEWRGAAGDEVRKCVVALHRANEVVDQARRELKAAQDEAEAAERDLNTAKRVYYAGQQDQERRIPAPRATPQKRQWLKALAEHDVFGAGEMRDAAEKVGWSAKDGALRTLASEYRNAGYFITVSHGVMRLDRKRIAEALGSMFDEKIGPDPQEPAEVDGDDDRDEPSMAETERRWPDVDDEYDDDPPSKLGDHLPCGELTKHVE